MFSRLSGGPPVEYVWRTRPFRIFRTPGQALNYYRCLVSWPARHPIRICIRGVPIPLLCRPGTSDAAVLWDTFGKAYHLPPVRLGETPVIVDLGANVGYTSVDFAIRFPKARIIAVEMDPDNAAIARENLRPVSDRCTLLNVAIWSSGGEVGYGGTAAWSLRVVPGSGKKARAVTVDELFDTLALETVDYLKMDIEGAEAEVLRRPPWLAKVLNLKVEIHPPADFRTCGRLLERSGFRVARTTWNPRCISATRQDGFDEPLRGEIP